MNTDAVLELCGFMPRMMKVWTDRSTRDPPWLVIVTAGVKAAMSVSVRMSRARMASALNAFTVTGACNSDSSRRRAVTTMSPNP